MLVGASMLKIIIFNKAGQIIKSKFTFHNDVIKCVSYMLSDGL